MATTVVHILDAPAGSGGKPLCGGEFPTEDVGSAGPFCPACAALCQPEEG